MYKYLTLLLFVLIIVVVPAKAQEQAMSQTVRGMITDAESKQPLVGVAVVLVSNSAVSTITDDRGYYLLEGVPLGRQSFQFSYMGYSPKTVSEVMISSGKETELNISLTENIQRLKEVSIKIGRAS